MHKALKYLLPAIGLLALLPALALWLVSSERGSALLVDRLHPLLPEGISYSQLQGPLTGPLQITGLHLRQPGLTATIGQLRLAWSPGALLQGRLQLQALEVDSVAIVLHASDSEHPSSPLRPADLQLPIDLGLSRIRVTGLQLTLQDGQLIPLDEIFLQADLRDSQLELKQLRLSAPDGSLQLSASTALENDMPLRINASWIADAAGNEIKGSLAVDGAITWAESTAMQLKLGATAQGLNSLLPELPEQLAVAGSAAATLHEDQLQLEQLQLSLPDHGSALQLAAKVSGLYRQQPELAAQLEWQNLHWPLADTATFSSQKGTLELDGSLQSYALKARASLEGASMPPGDWSMEGTGTQQQLQLDSLTANIMQGQLQARGTVEWAPLLRWQLQLQGDGLQSAALLPEVDGELGLALESSGQLAGEQGLQAQLSLHYLEGTLLEHPLLASASLQLQGESANIEALAVRSGSNQLQASGSASPTAITLDWQLQAPAPGELLTGAAGTLRGRGDISGSPQAPVFAATVEGSELQLDALAIAELSLEIKAGLQAADTLAVKLQTAAVSNAGTVVATAASLHASGSNAEHTLALELETATEQLQTTLRGGLDQAFEQWTGKLTSLRLLSQDYGQWQLQKAASLALAPTTAELGQSCLRHEDGTAAACVAGSWLAQGDSRLQASVHKLPLALLNGAVGGNLNGEISAALSANNTLRANASLRASAGDIAIELQPPAEPLSHGGGELALTVDHNGLLALLDFAAPENGTVKARLAMPELTSLPLPDEQPLKGSLKASLPQLGALQNWVEALDDTHGSLSADLNLAGTLSQPRLQGQLLLSDASAAIPAAGLKLHSGALGLYSLEDKPALLAIDGSIQSGDGQLALSGQVDSSNSSVELQLQGQRFEAFNTKDARVLLSPALQIGWRDDTLTLRGDVLVPEARITPQLELSPAMAGEASPASSSGAEALAPSPDVVIISGQIDEFDTAPTNAPFTIDNQTRLVLGDDITVDALGLKGRISGQLAFLNWPGQTELIPMGVGMVSIEDGSFRAFGQDLDIRTGQLVFNNVPVTEPEINLRAVRWIDNDPQVSAAGLMLFGPATSPTMELFSRPQLQASEIQSYLLTGRSSGSKSDVLSIGTYLTPRVYVGYGYNTLEKTSEFNSLFTITPRYGVGLDLGEADNNLNLTFSYER